MDTMTTIKCSVESDMDDSVMNLSKPLGAGIILFKDDKFVVVRRREDGRLSFPKGIIKHPELFGCCAIRHCYDQTGIDVTKFKYLYTIHIGSKTTYRYYKIESEFELKQYSNSEISEVLLLTLEELKKLKSQSQTGRQLKLFIYQTLKRTEKHMKKHPKWFKYMNY